MHTPDGAIIYTYIYIYEKYNACSGLLISLVVLRHDFGTHPVAEFVALILRHR